eukprot:Hpha_TRINITY_DN16627_c0_g6::TRINITY_DN16627_c0_g6_i1::g.180392::m.180392
MADTKKIEGGALEKLSNRTPSFTFRHTASWKNPVLSSLRTYLPSPDPKVTQEESCVVGGTLLDDAAEGGEPLTLVFSTDGSGGWVEPEGTGAARGVVSLGVDPKGGALVIGTRDGPLYFQLDAGIRLQGLADLRTLFRGTEVAMRLPPTHPLGDMVGGGVVLRG